MATQAVQTPQRPGASLRLFCFPYAGGSVQAFRTWLAAMPSEVDVCAVQLPGRGWRFRERPHSRIEPLLAELHQELGGLLDRPFAFFGHSMGAVIAFELARLFTRDGHPPAWLFVSGRQAPRPERRDRPERHALPDDEFIAQVKALDGLPDEVLRESGLLDVILPTLKADFALSETYVWRDGPTLACPVSAFGGLRDPEVSREELLGWREQTTGIFRLRMFPGGHFFVQDTETALLRAVTDDLLRILTFQARGLQCR